METEMGTHDTLEQAFEQFLAQPTGQAYRALQERVAAHPAFRPGPNVLGQLLTAGQEGRHREVFDLMSETLPTLLLSPVVHLTIAQSAEALGSREMAGIEQTVARACLEGLAATGDGSEASPYRVLFRSEMSVVLLSLGTDARARRTVRKGAETYELVDCLDGTRRWFDLSLAVAPRPEDEPPLASPQAPSPDTGPRAHHYQFAQRVLPAFVFQKTPMLAQLVSEPSSAPELARVLWLGTGDGLAAGSQMPVDDLDAKLFRLGEGRYCWLVTLPPPAQPPEAYFVAVAFGDAPVPESTRYYLLEKSVLDPAFLCAVSPEGQHLSIGPCERLDAQDFVGLVAQLDEKSA